MFSRRIAVTAAALLVVVGCGTDRSTDPTAPSFTPESGAANRSELRARPIFTSGRFDANVDFSTLTLTPKGSDCLLQVSGQLVFTGTIDGTANATTTALVFASCADVASHPPGTYPDVFRSIAVFDGTVDGRAAHSDLVYTGRSQPGGHIDALFIFSNGVEGILAVDAQLAVGGSYRGPVVIR